jgi:hypothetical protein
MLESLQDTGLAGSVADHVPVNSIVPIPTGLESFNTAVGRLGGLPWVIVAHARRGNPEGPEGVGSNRICSGDGHGWVSPWLPSGGWVSPSLPWPPPWLPRGSRLKTVADGLPMGTVAKPRRGQPEGFVDGCPPAPPQPISGLAAYPGEWSAHLTRGQPGIVWIDPIGQTLGVPEPPNRQNVGNRYGWVSPGSPPAVPVASLSGWMSPGLPCPHACPLFV